MNDFNLYQRINAVMQAASKVHKSKFVSTGGSGGYKAVTHDDVTATLQPELVKAGIVMTVSHKNSELEQLTVTRKAGTANAYEAIEYQVTIEVEVTFINMDYPEERITVNGFAYAMDTSDKAAGKALSMAVKNILLKTFMLESCDDEESRDLERESSPVKKSGHTWGKPSERQLGMIRALNKKLGSPMTEANINAISNIQEASKIIEKMKAKEAEGDKITTDDIPF